MKVNLITKNIMFFKNNSSLSLQQGKIQIKPLGNAEEISGAEVKGTQLDEYAES